MRIGQIEILPVMDQTVHLPVRDFLRRPGVVSDPWASHREVVDDQGLHEFALGGFMIRWDDRIMLVDAGVGPDGDGDLPGGGVFLDSLRAHGVAPEDVTDVLFTHLHLDHVGWASHDGQVIFPNATHHVHAADWYHFVERPQAQGVDSEYVARTIETLLPLQDRIATFDREVTLAPGVDARPVPGHTPGSTVFIVSEDGERALLLGDAVHSHVELLEPGWQHDYDVDKPMAIEVREALGDELARTQWPAVGAHFRGLQFGHISVAGDTRRWNSFM